MEIISHRGFWLEDNEKNTIESFKRSFENSFGTETDIRDCNGTLVISHDIASNNSISVESFFELYNTFNIEGMLALNIKSDGLSDYLQQLIQKYQIKNYFVFDMSVPDSFAYKNKLEFFSRQSELEEHPIFYNECRGIWMDAFYNEKWISEELIRGHLSESKVVALVSPDLHKRDYLSFWSFLKSTSLSLEHNIILCTDFPKEAEEFFKTSNLNE